MRKNGFTLISFLTALAVFGLVAVVVLLTSKPSIKEVQQKTLAGIMTVEPAEERADPDLEEGFFHLDHCKIRSFGVNGFWIEAIGLADSKFGYEIYLHSGLDALYEEGYEVRFAIPKLWDGNGHNRALSVWAVKRKGLVEK